MREPIHIRNGVPFYYDKSSSQVKADPYERYDDHVLRQSLLHYGHRDYPLQEWLTYLDSLDLSHAKCIVEVGCSVGRTISHLAQRNPDSSCYGLDYSYQMIKRAQELHTNGEAIELKDWSTGLSAGIVYGSATPNLQFGLSRAEDLPCANDSADIIISSFLIDRLVDPLSFILEAHRSLKHEGQLLVLSPLNYNSASNWANYYPLSELLKAITQQGFQLVHLRDHLSIVEPIDLSGNQIKWNCALIHLTKI